MPQERIFAGEDVPKRVVPKRLAQAYRAYMAATVEVVGFVVLADDGKPGGSKLADHLDADDKIGRSFAKSVLDQAAMRLMDAGIKNPSQRALTSEAIRYFEDSTKKLKLPRK